jgi:2-oxoglutarate/2-oxoacid ferredoxin oxidoreductase subunit beta
MVKIEDYGEYTPAWCPGCGDFGILKSLKQALVASGLEPHQVLLVSGIGQAAKTPHYLNVNVFNGLHGRALPPATGAKLANPSLKVIVTSGDGCSYGEGGNHFLAAIRRNIDITLLVHDNQIYGLTKGQCSPTSMEGQVTKTQPEGNLSSAFNPVVVAVAMKCSFVARTFSGFPDHAMKMMQLAIAHKGFSLVDIFQPCVSFNKTNTFKWYKDRCYELSADYDPANWNEAMKRADEFGDKIPIGVIYKNDRSSFESKIHVLEQGPLVGREVDKQALKHIIESYL